MPNRLAQESSPYLLQHANNPVDWYAWGPDAIDRARTEDKPILLSIGYAACHWCHVMAHESFEDPATAAVMNEHFVNVKVDREERPDIDGIYMTAVQALTGHGGWPMTVFLTPDGDPFYGGTYFPPADKHGLPSFTKVLKSVADAYRNQREAIDQSAAQLKQIYKSPPVSTKAEQVTPHMLEIAFRDVSQHYDPRYGGFDGAPKFPQTMALDFMLRYGARTGSSNALEMVLNSFRKMARGGIYDQIAGGFARYSVDEMWLVPHFEKMLYDNALLSRLGVHLWQASKDEEIRRVTEQTLEWVRREMTSPEGGFYSSLDADSEGHEGKFYVWDESELDTLLGDDARMVKTHYGVTPGGNFEGRNILFVQAGLPATAARLAVPEAEVSAALDRANKILYEARSRRVWPGRDEKVLASWNGLMLRAVAEAARAFKNETYREMAVRNAEFLSRKMVRDGHVMRSFKDGSARVPGFLEDHAALGLGFLAVYELTFDEAWVQRSLDLARRIEDFFWDEERCVFFDTASDAETLITRPREVADNAVPAGNSLAADLFLHLANLTEDDELRGKAERVLRPLALGMMKHAPAFGYLLGVAEALVFGGVQVAIAGPATNAEFKRLNRVVAERYVPGLVLAGGDPLEAKMVALLRERELIHGSATAHVCRRFACDLPTADSEVLASQLAEAVRVRDSIAAR